MGKIFIATIMVEGGEAQQFSTVDKAQTDANIEAKWDSWYVPAL